MDLNASRWTPVEGSTFEFDSRSAGAEWIRVRGGGLSRVVTAKFAVVAGTPRLIGLTFDDGKPLAARLLREPRIPEMEVAFALYIAQETERRHVMQEHFAGLIASDHRTNDGGDDLRSTSDVVDQWESEHSSWIAKLGDIGDKTALRGRGRGSCPPTGPELSAFAHELMTQQLAGRGAVTRTAKAIGMNRSTAYRWIEACQERGLLPPKEND